MYLYATIKKLNDYIFVLHIESQKYYTHVNKAVLPATIGNKMSWDTALKWAFFTFYWLQKE